MLHNGNSREWNNAGGYMTKKFLFNKLRLGAEGNMKRRFKYTRDVSSSTIYQNDTALFAEYKRVRSRWCGTRHAAGNLSRRQWSPAYLLSIQNAVSCETRPTRKCLSADSSKENSFVAYNWFANSHTNLLHKKILTVIIINLNILMY